jgi:hypothetical protein
MEPVITTIVAALVAGATAATKDVATQAIKDAYHGLKGLVTGKYAGTNDAVEAIDDEPESDLDRQVLANVWIVPGLLTTPSSRRPPRHFSMP